MNSRNFANYVFKVDKDYTSRKNVYGICLSQQGQYYKQKLIILGFILSVADKLLQEN